MRPEQIREIDPLKVEAEIRAHLKKYNLKMCEEDIESLICKIVDLRENEVFSNNWAGIALNSSAGPVSVFA